MLHRQKHQFQLYNGGGGGVQTKSKLKITGANTNPLTNGIPQVQKTKHPFLHKHFGALTTTSRCDESVVPGFQLQ